MSQPEARTLLVTCPACHQVGSITWQAPSAGSRAPRKVLLLSNFHAENETTDIGEPRIVCDRCGAHLSD